MTFTVLNANTIERLPWPVRTFLGGCAAALSVVITYAIVPLRAMPLLIAFPAVVLSAWFFGMAGSFGCALVDAILVDTLLTRAEFRFSSGFERQEVRLSVFLVLSTLVGVLLRRWADQRAELKSRELKKNLVLERAQRQMAEERVRAGEALRDREEVLRIALRANGMGVWSWDLQQDLIERSDEVFRMVGCEPGQFGPNPDAWLPFVHPDDREVLLNAFEKARSGAHDYHCQYRVRWPDGSLHWLESQGKCLRDNEGRPARIVGVMADVTHRKHAEEAMVRAEKLAVAGRLAASVAHEINNPLEAVANLLYLITISHSLDETHKHAHDAMEEVLRVSMITQSTLKFHRQPGTPKITMLSEIIESVTTMFRERLGASGIDLQLQIASEVAIACMPSEAQQIFANLLANAVEAMPNGGRLVIRLRASCNWRDPNVQGMRVTICDSGVGMDRVTMRRIFEPFFTTKAETGTGLGMWVVAQLVDRHGGNVHVWSRQRYGKSGAAFTVFLPMESLAPVEGVYVESRELDAIPPIDAVV